MNIARATRKQVEKRIAEMQKISCVDWKVPEDRDEIDALKRRLKELTGLEPKRSTTKGGC